jgi:hypothetical protein
LDRTTIKPTIITVIAVTILILTISSQRQQQVIFAMHDSNLDVNTWLASDNSTQLHTTDLNKGSMGSTSTITGGAETEGGEVTEDEEEEDEGEPSTDENGEDEEEDE